MTSRPYPSRAGRQYPSTPEAHPSNSRVLLYLRSSRIWRFCSAVPVWRWLQISRRGAPRHLSGCGRTRPPEHETVMQPRHPFRVDLAWRREPGQTRDRVHENLPLNVGRHAGVRFHQAVVVWTHHHPVGQGSIAARPPRLIVVRLARRRRGIAAGECAPLVPQ